MKRTLSTLLTVLLLPIPPVDAYVNPATGIARAGRVLRGFDKPAQNWLPGHRGVDLELQVGDNVLAASDGIVTFRGSVAGTPTLSLDHADGVRTTYQPIHSPLSAGDAVKEGAVIGTLGHPTTPFPGLQWGARIGDDYVNPLGLLPSPTIRLKPLVDA